jgi:hypothetical protein
MSQMKIQSQRQMINQLIPAIKLIAGDFEEFGGKFLDHLLKIPLEHSGVNFLGQPVNRVLDSTSDDGAVVAQYSAETAISPARCRRLPTILTRRSRVGRRGTHSVDLC